MHERQVVVRVGDLNVECGGDIPRLRRFDPAWNPETTSSIKFTLTSWIVNFTVLVARARIALSS